ncbi:putative oxidoreductase [Posidoniimonas polymericola]|uniref:Putative oxidoreductase n=1 Tax=Posidoniimonas polymericola TaxID=2528002 RepID=A0A5C5YM02_9BACT|nr:FAD-dependent oxidoreductase [Posidoniimonas polymericola]TWT76003.1 putative oxidoreductase [Posidoniimonas polymericola]
MSEGHAAEIWDAVVIGAGLAGAATSYQLARWGKRVLLVEAKEFPRGKVCGGCLNERAIDAFRQIGLGDLLESAGARPYDQMRLHAHGRSVQLPIPAGLAATRETVDQLLVERAVGAGVTFQHGVRARVAAAAQDDYREVRLGGPRAENPETVRARVVIACDGLGRPSLAELPGLMPAVSSNSRLGLGAIVPAGSLKSLDPAAALQMVVGRSGYVGFSLCEAGRVSIAAAVDRGAIATGNGPADTLRAVLREARVADEPALEEAAWRGTKPLSQRVGRVADHRLLLVGDAAGYVEPFTGEGMAAALEGSVLAADLLAQSGNDWRPRMAESWQTTYTASVRTRQRACSRLAWLLRRPRMTHLTLRLLEYWPALGAHTAKRISSTSSHRKDYAAWAPR